MPKPLKKLTALIRTMDGRYPERALDWLVQNGVMVDHGYSVNKRALAKLLAGVDPEHAAELRDFIEGVLSCCATPLWSVRNPKLTRIKPA
jgi:hypothetical protein